MGIVYNTGKFRAQISMLTRKIANELFASAAMTGEEWISATGVSISNKIVKQRIEAMKTTETPLQVTGNLWTSLGFTSYFGSKQTGEPTFPLAGEISLARTTLRRGEQHTWWYRGKFHKYIGETGSSNYFGIVKAKEEARYGHPKEFLSIRLLSGVKYLTYLEQVRNVNIMSAVAQTMVTMGRSHLKRAVDRNSGAMASQELRKLFSKNKAITFRQAKKVLAAYDWAIAKKVR